MKQKIKLHITHYFTKRCLYGNVYHAVKIQNIKTGKSFTASTPSLGNVTNILHDAFGGWDKCGFTVSEAPTGSARFSSIPDAIHSLNPCSFKDGKPYQGSWKKELNAIGFRLPRLS